MFSNFIAAQILVFIISISSTLKGIGPRFGDGVYTSSNKICLPYIVRSDNHLHFFNSLQRNGVASTWETGTEAEVIVEIGTINSKIGRTAISSSKTHIIGIGGNTGNI